ncbi:MAG TPA: hypothetical protein VMG80_03075 [Solirubrobacteraceae bacterium]|nr:hypothetical protein [Solirubrobacteraceae bacterium]
MPNRHPRHLVTETPPIHEALNAERDDEARRAELRRQLVERLHTGDGIDANAAYEVREHGWTHR